jgi:hypothetical protein
MSILPLDLSLSLARREKRLRFWQSALFSQSSLNEIEMEKIKRLLSSFRLLLSKYALSENISDQEKYELEVSGLERELTSFFESRRLLTSKIGIPAVPDHSS